MKRTTRPAHNVLHVVGVGLRQLCLLGLVFVVLGCQPLRRALPRRQRLGSSRGLAARLGVRRRKVQCRERIVVQPAGNAFGCFSVANAKCLRKLGFGRDFGALLVHLLQHLL